MSTARVARSVKLDPEIDARLTALAQRTGRTEKLPFFPLLTRYRTRTVFSP